MAYNIKLEKGKEYLIYIAYCFASSFPIVQLYKKYNPIFICGENPIDAPKKNFISVREELEALKMKVNLENIAKVIVNSKKLTGLFNSLKKHQGEVWVKIFENDIVFKELFNKPYIKSLGLLPEQNNRLSNKLYQYELLKDVVPIPEFVITKKEKAVEHFGRLDNGNGVFTHLPYGGAGSGARIHKDKASLAKYLATITDKKFILAMTLDVNVSPSIDILIANKDEIFIFGLADQILDGLKCLGATYPSVLPTNIRKECYDIAYKVAKKIAQSGIKGYITIDLIVDKNNNVYFCEINARYAGTTHNRMLAMEKVKPLGSPSIVDLEVMAIKEGTFNGHKLWDEPKEIFWYKKEIFPEFNGTVKQLSMNNDSLELYKKGKGFVIVGQRRIGTVFIKNKTSLGNLICIEKTSKKLEKSIILSNTVIKKYIGN